MVRLNRTYYSLLKITSKIFKIPPVKFQRITQIPHSSPTQVREFRKIRTIRLTCYTLCFSHLSRQRTLRNSSELRKFRAVCPHSLRIPQNSHILHYVSGTCPGREPCRIPANYADSAQFAHTVRESREFRTLRTKTQIYVIDFQIPDHRQRTQENWSEPTTFRSIRPPIMRITRILRILQ